MGLFFNFYRESWKEKRRPGSRVEGGERPELMEERLAVALVTETRSLGRKYDYFVV